MQFPGTNQRPHPQRRICRASLNNFQARSRLPFNPQLPFPRLPEFRYFCDSEPLSCRRPHVIHPPTPSNTWRPSCVCRQHPTIYSGGLCKQGKSTALEFCVLFLTSQNGGTHVGRVAEALIKQATHQNRAVFESSLTTSWADSVDWLFAN